MTVRPVAALLFVALGAASGHGQPAAVPVLDSRPGSAYTLYLDFAGFAYTGTWFGDPVGTTPAFDTDGSAASFSPAEVRQIRDIWSRSAEKYAVFGINVTTVDPAPAGATDLQRQQYYDAQPRLMHTVVGGTGGWLDPTGGTVGVSALGSTAATASGGRHTNWIFAENYGANTKGIAETVAHENGHGLHLDHQGVGTGTGYDPYDPGTGTGPGSRAPIMGNSDNAQRGLWRGAGPSGDDGFALGNQNDVTVLLANAGIKVPGSPTGGYVTSPAGRTPAAATPLPLAGTVIDFTAAKGVITPISADPIARGEANYTKDYFKVVVPAGGAGLTVVLNSGRSTLTPGVADPGATLDATLRLLDAAGLTLFESKTSTLTETISTTSLAAGTYYLEIASAGDDDRYFDLGSYFLTGTLTPVPEPGWLLAAAAAGVGVWTRRRAG